jgi:hypothetical protein
MAISRWLACDYGLKIQQLSQKWLFSPASMPNNPFVKSSAGEMKILQNTFGG